MRSAGRTHAQSADAVTIGRVTALGLVSAEYGTGETIDVERQTYRQVFVRYVVDTAKIGRVPDTKTSVDLGLRARLASQGITGLSYLELDFVNPAQYPALTVPWTPKGQYIPSMPSAFTQVRDAAQEFLAKLNRLDIDALSAHLNGLISDVRAEMSSGDLHNTLVQATAVLRTTNEAIAAADLPGLSADLKRTSAAVRDKRLARLHTRAPYRSMHSRTAAVSPLAIRWRTVELIPTLNTHSQRPCGRMQARMQPRGCGPCVGPALLAGSLTKRASGCERRQLRLGRPSERSR